MKKAWRKGFKRYEIVDGPEILSFAADLLGKSSGQVFFLGDGSSTVVVTINSLRKKSDRGHVWAFKGEGLDPIHDQVTMFGEYDLVAKTGWVEFFTG